MNILSDLKMYGRFAWGLRGFLRHPITLEEAKAIVQRRMAEREENFLRLVRKGIFGYPKSPYLPLLKLAQCEMGDIENMIRSRGLEKTLLALRKAGVYVAFEEFKGREPIVRNGKVIPVEAHDFDNPYLSHYYKGETGGSTGPGTRVSIDLDHLAAQTPNVMVSYDALKLFDIPFALWFGVPPDPTALSPILIRARFGHVARKWFSPMRIQDEVVSLKDRFAIQYFVFVGWLNGIPIPRPEFVSLDQPAPIVHWISETLQTHGACLLIANVSKALRVCIAALEQGLDLSGNIFLTGGEPHTSGKVQQITRTGAQCVPTYFFTETGFVGMSCARPADCNDIHLFKDILALIQHPRQLPDMGVSVDAFYFTTLLSTVPKIMLNVESDDYGVIESRSCGCPLERYGFTDHLRDIHSFRKLTGEGVTLVGSEMVYILEEVLPNRFGGSPLDYQLSEEEDEQGLTRLSLIINPKVEIKEEKEVIGVVLEALKRSSVSADLAQAIWRQAQTIKIKRMEPIWTARGKLMTLHLSQRPEHKVAQEGGK
jgi:hypothetical protein